MFRAFLPLFFVAVLSTGSPAQVVDSWVVPAAFASKNASGSSSFPWTYTGYVRLQQAMTSQVMGRPRLIEGMALRPKQWGTAQQKPFVRNLSVKISLSAKAVNQLDGTYANNVKGPQTEVWRGPVHFQTPTGNSPAEFSVTIWFKKKFLYTGTDPLLLDFAPLEACAGGGTSQGCDYDPTDPGMGTVLGKNKLGCGIPKDGGSRNPGGFVIKFFGPAVMPYGLACKGSNGVPVIANTGGGPTLGNVSFALTLAQAAKSSAAVLVLGFSRDRFGGTVPLPLDLKGAGAPGCFLWTDLALLGTAPTDAAGNAKFALPIPPIPGLANTALYTQWIVGDPTANSLGLAFSPGGIVAIR